MQIVICAASDFCEVKMEKNMSILKKVKRKLYKIFLPMKYARLAGVNFRGGSTYMGKLLGAQNLGSSRLGITST